MEEGQGKKVAFSIPVSGTCSYGWLGFIGATYGAHGAHTFIEADEHTSDWQTRKVFKVIKDDLGERFALFKAEFITTKKKKNDDAERRNPNYLFNEDHPFRS